MRWSRTLIPTLKEAPADATSPSHVFLIRGGFVRRVAAGVYTFLPLGWRVVRKVERVIREEMERAGAVEVHMPSVMPAELWRESGRWDGFGPELLKFKDRKGGEFCLGPTHEEAIVEVARRDLRSYRELPVNLFQIQTKFRDEPRPRGGLLRGREFIMKDAYSFDAGEQGARRSYQTMVEAYRRIFTRCGLSFRMVEADTGAIGGERSHEFQVLADTGEDAIVACDACDYAANVEMAALAPRAAAAGGGPDAPRDAPPRETPPPEQVATPGKRTIEEVSSFLGAAPATFIKTLVYLADDRPVAALVRGDHEVNEAKLRRLCGAREVELAPERVIEQATGAPVGFAGPVGLSLPLLVDHDVAALRDAVTGANKRDAHLRHVRPGRDFPAEPVDLRQAAAGDACARCGNGRYRSFRGIEAGHVFLLGTRYSEPMACTFLDEQGQQRPMVMGCYGIGVTRVAAAAIEQGHDDSGIVWPLALAPYHVEVIPLQMNEPAVVEAGERIERELSEAGIEVLLDDRGERAGAKFKDADLLGIPYRIVIGARSLKEGHVEVARRAGGGAEKVPAADAACLVAGRVAAELRAAAEPGAAVGAAGGDAGPGARS